MQWRGVTCQQWLVQQKSRLEGGFVLPTSWPKAAKVGGARGSRTPDLVNAIHALSQLSYGPNLQLRPPH